ncbi:MAG: hypothetical protein Q4A25_00430 [Candidatus Saccharibacteria bacterium]|nr:hypothetical protein [Candidatus Saccharibacteria bacterium]
MKLREKIAQKRFLGPLLGLIFAFFLCFVNSSSTSAKPLSVPIHTTPITVLADPIEGIETPEEETETTEENSEEKSEEEPETCYDQVKGIGWLVCPTSGVLAKAVDSIYKVISDLLVVQPMTTDSDSPVFIVWQYVRDLTNIVFIILILVVIYSHLTGVGFDNYNIKKILPKLIITAILINLSYLICSALIDTSNIAGASLRGFFENIESQINASGDAMITWEAFAAMLGGGGAVAGLAVSAAGGIGAILPMFILSLLSAFISILVGLATIAMRQAVVALLVMVAPLAFVCYMLPNTNKWFTKWKDILTTMLIFFPMFSALFGASHLAGWAIIAKAQQDGSLFMTILGMAVQVVPFFLAIPMMKMSGSVLGKVSGALDNLGKNTTGRLRPVAEDFRDTARAKKLDEASRSRNYASGAYWRARFDRNKYLRAEDRAEHEENRKITYSAYSNARSTGRTLKRWENGRAVYKTKKDKDGNEIDNVKVTSAMRDNYLNRELKLAAEADDLKTANAMSNVNAYLRSTEAKEDKILKALADNQAQNYLDLRTQQSAKARNDRSDQRFYFEQVQKASKIDKSGNIVNRSLYNQLVRTGAGADAHDSDETIRQNALTTVTADAYEAFEKQRKETTSKYATYFDKQITKNVLHGYDGALHNKNIEAVVAAQNTLAKRGDYDKIEEYLAHFMDHTKNKKGTINFENQDGYVELGSDFANVLASDLLQYKDAAPILGRLGKFINMETWRNSNTTEDGKPLRSRSYITMEEYNQGGYDYVEAGQPQTYNIKTSSGALQKGTSIGNIDRTGFGAMQQHIDRYHHGDEEYFTSYVSNFLPEIISNVPKFETDGEQIMNTLGFMTGMKWDEKHATWKQGDGQIHMAVIRKYMDGQTDKDMNVFKTNAYQAICSAIAIDMGECAYKTIDGSGRMFNADGSSNLELDKNGNPQFNPSENVLQVFRGMVRKDVINTLQNNINHGTNGGMKPTIMRALGLTIPDSTQK